MRRSFFANSWDLTAGEILALAKATCDRVREGYAAIAACKDSATYANVIQKMTDTDTFADVIENSCTFPAHTSTDKEIRDAATEAEKLFNALGVECAMNYEVYQAVAAYAAKKEKLGPEQQRLVDRLMRDYRFVYMESYRRRCGVMIMPRWNDAGATGSPWRRRSATR